MGLTLSDAYCLLLMRVAREKALPFEPLRPNAETVAAIEAAGRGDLVMVGPSCSSTASLTMAVLSWAAGFAQRVGVLR